MPVISCLSLGCYKNLADSEKFLASLSEQGFEITENIEDSEALVINTCGFIDPAKEESIEAVLEAVEEKKKGKLKLIAVVGCMVEVWKADLIREIPEVDIWLGLGEICRLGEEMADRLGRPEQKGPSLPRMITTPPHLSFLKISEGCSLPCTFCLIPKIRGPLISRPMQDILEEAKFLEEQGVKEINLIAQDIASYGRDRGEKGALTGLIKKLIDTTSVPWYRLLYIHPENIDDALIELTARETRLLSYLDLPFQHISAKILKAMGRRKSEDEIVSLIERLRKKIPGLALRTTLMVGFPGENDDDFERLLQFVRDVRFDWMGAFVYSPQEKTKAAGFSDKVPQEIAKERYDILLETQLLINAEMNQERIGKTETVLVDEKLEEGEPDYMGRTAYQAYEIDGAVMLKGGFQTGSFEKVKITDYIGYDLIGEKAD
jgi:ribosomal protein S12 methylthiotransferase